MACSSIHKKSWKSVDSVPGFLLLHALQEKWSKLSSPANWFGHALEQDVVNAHVSQCIAETTWTWVNANALHLYCLLYHRLSPCWVFKVSSFIALLATGITQLWWRRLHMQKWYRVNIHFFFTKHLFSIWKKNIAAIIQLMAYSSILSKYVLCHNHGIMWLIPYSLNQTPQLLFISSPEFVRRLLIPGSCQRGNP